MRCIAIRFLYSSVSSQFLTILRCSTVVLAILERQWYIDFFFLRISYLSTFSQRKCRIIPYYPLVSSIFQNPDAFLFSDLLLLCVSSVTFYWRRSNRRVLYPSGFRRHQKIISRTIRAVIEEPLGPRRGSPCSTTCRMLFFTHVAHWHFGNQIWTAKLLLLLVQNNILPACTFRKL